LSTGGGAEKSSVTGSWKVKERDTTMPTNKPRFTITLDEELLERIENYRFENRCPNRTQAVLDLLHMGLDDYDKLTKGKQSKPSSQCKKK